MSLKWFGTSWGAPICDFRRHVAVPVGRPCIFCEEPIDVADAGFIDPPGVSHYACFMRQIIGSVAHIEKRCGCYVKDALELDDPNLTVRQAAEAAVAAYERQKKQ